MPVFLPIFAVAVLCLAIGLVLWLSSRSSRPPS